MSLNNIIQPGMKAVFYGRHSTDKQNMDTQLRSAYDFAEKYHCEIIDEYMDEAVSSRKKERKGLELLIKDASANKFDFIIIYSHSRLARIPEEHDALRITMSVLGIHIVESSTETLYGYGDIVYSSIKDAIAKYELDKIRKVTRDSIATLLNKGLWTGGRAPFGYKYHKKLRRTGKKDNSSEIAELSKSLSSDLASTVQNGRFERIEHELLLVKKVFSLYKDGYGFRQIADKMPSLSYRGKDWDYDKVKQVIINPFYAGYLSIRKRKQDAKNSLNKRDEWKMNKSPLIDPVISLSEWEECFRLYEQRKEKTIPPNFYKTSFLVNNLLFCKTCNQYFSGKDQRSNGYGSLIYVCKSCKKKFKAEDIHQDVMKNLVQLQKKNTEKMIADIQNKVHEECKSFDEEITVLTQAVEQDELKLHTLNAKIQKLFLVDGDETIIKVLSIGKEMLTNSIREKSIQISELQKAVQVLKEIDGDRIFIENKIMDFQQLTKLPDIRLRKLYLYFIESINVDPSIGIEYKFRVDLE